MAALTFDTKAPMNRSRAIRTFTFLVWVCTLVSCVTTNTADYQNTEFDRSALVDAAALGTGDIIEIRVHKHADLSGVYEVPPSGDIDFPYIGNLIVAGKTSSMLQTTIRTQLANGFYVNPTVTVNVKERRSKKVFVLGQVKKPGAFVFEDNMTIVQAIVLAGGFTSLASRNSTTVRRVENGTETQMSIPVEQIITEKNTKNFLLIPGDIVYVPEAVL